MKHETKKKIRLLLLLLAISSFIIITINIRISEERLYNDIDSCIAKHDLSKLKAIFESADYKFQVEVLHGIINMFKYNRFATPVRDSALAFVSKVALRPSSHLRKMAINSLVKASYSIITKYEGIFALAEQNTKDSHKEKLIEQILEKTVSPGVNEKDYRVKGSYAIIINGRLNTDPLKGLTPIKVNNYLKMVKSVACINSDVSVVGHYESTRSLATRTKYNVRIVDLARRKYTARTIFYGDPPPVKIKVYGKYSFPKTCRGNPPSISRIQEWIDSLPEK